MITILLAHQQQLSRYAACTGSIPSKSHLRLSYGSEIICIIIIIVVVVVFIIIVISDPRRGRYMVLHAFIFFFFLFFPPRFCPRHISGTVTRRDSKLSVLLGPVV